MPVRPFKMLHNGLLNSPSQPLINVLLCLFGCLFNNGELPGNSVFVNVVV